MDIKLLETQEIIIKNQTENFYAKNGNGFCDFSLKGIEYISIGLNHVKFENINENSDIINAKRNFTYLHYDRIFYSFKACYNLFTTGYYLEASIILRSIIESFVRLKYIEKKGTTIEILQILNGHLGYKGKIFYKKNKTLFNTVSEGFYDTYQTLCDLTHGSCANLLLKDEEKIGLNFLALKSTYITNQFAVYLLAHIEFFQKIFPEIQNNLNDENLANLNYVKNSLWSVMTSMSKNEKNKEWYKIIKKLIEY